MRLLLDTHIWLWSLLEPDRVDAPMAQRLDRADSELWLSPVSIWEAHLLAERGRLELDRPPALWLNDALRLVPMRDAPLTRDVAFRKPKHRPRS